MTFKYKDPFDIKGPLLSYPLSLTDGLSSLSKQQLTTISKLLGIRGFSKLNKSELAVELNRNMPNHLDETFRLWDMHRVKIIQKAVKNKGRITDLREDWNYYEYFMDRGILFPTFINDREAYLMPMELVVWFNEAGIMNVQSNVRRNTEWIKLTMGMLYRYGALTHTQLNELVFKHAEIKPDSWEFFYVIADAAQYYLEIEFEYDDDIVYYFNNRFPEDIIEEHNFRSQLEFYPFTRQQILQAGEPDYNEKSKHYEQLVRYLATTYRMSREDADLIVEDCEWEINNLATVGDLIEGITEWIEFSSITEAEALTDRVVEMMNNTRQWALKGYSPTELSAKSLNRKPAILNQVPSQSSKLAVLNQVPNQSSKPAVLNQVPSQSGRADVISFETKQKIGRNDPCPCGSGAKFKKCCGR